MRVTEKVGKILNFHRYFLCDVFEGKFQNRSTNFRSSTRQTFFQLSFFETWTTSEPRRHTKYKVLYSGPLVQERPFRIAKKTLNVKIYDIKLKLNMSVVWRDLSDPLARDRRCYMYWRASVLAPYVERSKLDPCFPIGTSCTETGLAKTESLKIVKKFCTYF